MRLHLHLRCQMYRKMRPVVERGTLETRDTRQGNERHDRLTAGASAVAGLDPPAPALTAEQVRIPAVEQHLNPRPPATAATIPPSFFDGPWASP